MGQVAGNFGGVSSPGSLLLNNPFMQALIDPDTFELMGRVRELAGDTTSQLVPMGVSLERFQMH